MMSLNDVDWEGEWIIFLAFGLQFAYSIWVIIEACKGRQTKLEITSVFFQFIIQYFYVWYFVQKGMFYSSIGLGVLSFAAIIAFIVAAHHRRKRTHKYHHTHKKCGKVHRHENMETPSTIHPASHPNYIHQEREHRKLYQNHVSDYATTYF